MKKNKKLIVLLTVFITSFNSIAQLAGFEYINPLPGSDLIMPGNNIALRIGEPIKRQSVAGVELTVTGSASGIGRHQNSIVPASNPQCTDLGFGLYRPAVRVPSEAPLKARRRWPVNWNPRFRGASSNAPSTNPAPVSPGQGWRIV